jgi:hypothetical protein
MNVAVVERTPVYPSTSSARETALGATDGECEWIDPEGDDWFSSIYWELMGGLEAAKSGRVASELEHWFG